MTSEKNDVTKTVLSIRKELKKFSTAESKKSFQRFFKNPVLCHGVKSADVLKVGKVGFSDSQNLSKKQIYQVCEELFKSGYCEESWVAANWVYWFASYEEADFKIFERWIDKYIDNWAECDTFCNHAVGAFIEKFPKHIAELKIWAKSRNLWLRRAAAVSLIVPAKKGKYLKDAFEISDILLEDKEDMVQKGYGWLLKEESRLHRDEVLKYVLKNKKKMPRTSLRYAIELMPQSLRKKAMSRE